MKKGVSVENIVIHPMVFDNKPIFFCFLREIFPTGYVRVAFFIDFVRRNFSNGQQQTVGPLFLQAEATPHTKTKHA